jgi:hypothetical protein
MAKVYTTGYIFKKVATHLIAKHLSGYINVKAINGADQSKDET